MAGRDFPVACEVLKDPGHGGSNCRNFFGGLHLLSGFFMKDVAFRMHVVIAGIIGFYRPEGSHSNVEGQEGVVEF